jgi:hypothetical protein
MVNRKIVSKKMSQKGLNMNNSMQAAGAAWGIDDHVHVARVVGGVSCHR